MVQALQVDLHTPSTLYARVDIKGVFKSTDGGSSSSATGLTNAQVSAFTIDPQTPTTLYAGAWRGVFKSTDGGASWTEMKTGLTHLTVFVLSIDPQPPTTLYAGTGGGVFVMQQVLVADLAVTKVDVPTRWD